MVVYRPRQTAFFLPARPLYLVVPEMELWRLIRVPSRVASWILTESVRALGIAVREMALAAGSFWSPILKMKSRVIRSVSCREEKVK